MPAITLSNPVVAPATEEATYPIMWVPFIQIMAPDVNGECRVIAKITAMRALPDGTREMSAEKPKTYVCDNWFEKCAADPRAAQVMGDLLALLKEYAEA